MASNNFGIEGDAALADYGIPKTVIITDWCCGKEQSFLLTGYGRDCELNCGVYCTGCGPDDLEDCNYCDHIRIA